MLRVILVLVALVSGVLPAGSAAGQSPPSIKHVFVIVLENKNASETFGADSQAPYLAKDLRSRGQYVPNYYGIGHLSLANYIAMVSGQAPNPQTQGDCPIFSAFAPGTIGADGQALGTGCVYPATVKTIADQLSGAGLSWKGYMEDMGKDPTRDGGTTCAHPAVNSRDTSQSASAKSQYAARHNPFVYFHSIIDTPACAANDVPLDRLTGDLSSAGSTPNFAFITPDLCNDAHDARCADGGPGGLIAANIFLKQWVPRITSSPAFRDGLLIITFDESGSDSSACCGEPTGPNTLSPGGIEPGPGGGKVGAVLLGPHIAPGSTSDQPYNHYSLLRSIEDIFGLSHLGYAGMAGLRAFGADVYDAKPGVPALTASNLTVSPGAFAPVGRSSRAHVRRGATIRLTLNRAATIRLRFRKLTTRRSDGRRRVRALTRRGHAGRNAIRFTGRLGRSALSPGRWQVIATATAGGKTTAARRRSFTILRG